MNACPLVDTLTFSLMPNVDFSCIDSFSFLFSEQYQIKIKQSTNDGIEKGLQMYFITFYALWSAFIPL